MSGRQLRLSFFSKPTKPCEQMIPFLPPQAGQTLYEKTRRPSTGFSSGERREITNARLNQQCGSHATAMTAATNLLADLDLESLLNGSPILYESSRKCIAYRDHGALCKRSKLPTK